jgi:hypothetical protein
MIEEHAIGIVLSNGIGQRSVKIGAMNRDAIGALTETWRRWGHEIGCGVGIAHGFATLGTIGFERRFDYAAIGTETWPLGCAMRLSQGRSSSALEY